MYVVDEEVHVGVVESLRPRLKRRKHVGVILNVTNKYVDPVRSENASKCVNRAKRDAESQGKTLKSINSGASASR